MPKWFTIQNKSDKEPVEILIYDQIGRDWFSNDGVDAKDFAEELKAIDKDREIIVGINSPGGNVWDGLAIYHQLKARGEKVTTRVDGVAASIASVIFQAGHRREMPANSMAMIHKASGLCIGDSDDMRDMIDRLEKHDEVLADIYAKRTGKTRAEMLLLMKAETWMTGREAKEMGFSDTVTEEVKMAATFGRVLGQLQQLKLNAAKSGETTTKQMKEKLIAILATLGVTVAKDATEDTLFTELQKALDAKPSAELMASIAADLAAVLKAKPTAAAPPPANDDKIIDLKAVQAKLKAMEEKAEAERVRRVTGELRAIIAERPFLDEKDWLPRAIADETVLATLKAMPALMAGIEPIRMGAVDLGNDLLEKYRKMKAGEERRDFHILNFDLLRQTTIKFQPRAANTYSATLVTDFLSDALITVAHNKLAALRIFSRDFGTDPMKPRATVQVRKVTATAVAVQVNPTNFETGDSTTVNVPVTVDQISRSFHVTNDELNKGHRLAHVAKINADVFADKISDVWTALMIAANFPTPVVIGVASAFDMADVGDIWAAIKNVDPKGLILDGSHLGKLLPSDRTKFTLRETEAAFGFANLGMQNRWTGAVANAVGFAGSPDSVAVASGLPIETAGAQYLSTGTVMIEGIELTVVTHSWFSLAGRINWASYDVMFGAAVGDNTKGEILVSA